MPFDHFKLVVLDICDFFFRFVLIHGWNFKYTWFIIAKFHGIELVLLCVRFDAFILTGEQ